MDNDIILLIDWLIKNEDDPEAIRRFKDAVAAEMNGGFTGNKTNVP